MSDDNSLMAGPVPTFGGQRTSQYLTGAIDSDDDGIPVVDGGYGSASVSEVDGIAVIYAESSSELESSWGSDEDGMSSSLESAAWQSFPRHFGVESSQRSPPLKKKGLVPVIVLTSQTDESSSLSASSFSTTWSSSTGDDEDDHTSMASRIISNIDALKLFWRGETGGKRNTKMRRSPSPSHSSTLEVESVEPTEGPDDCLTSVYESSAMSSSAAAPYMSAGSDESWFGAGNSRCGGSGQVPSLRSLTESSSSSSSASSSSSSSSFAVESCGMWRDEANTVAESSFKATTKERQTALPVYPVKTRKSTELQESGTEKLSALSTAGESSATAPAGDGSSASMESSLEVARKERTCCRRTSFVVSFLVVFVIASVVAFLGAELWWNFTKARPSTDRSSPPDTAQPSRTPPTEPTPPPSLTGGYAVPMTLHLLFRQPVRDMETMAKVFEDQLSIKLSTMDGFLRIEMSPVELPLAANNFRSRRRTVITLLATAVFDIGINMEILSEVPEGVCQLLNDPEKVQQALQKEPTLVGVVYEGPSGGDCGRDIFASPTTVRPPSESPSQIFAENPGSNYQESTTSTPMPTPWRRTPRPITTLSPTVAPKEGQTAEPSTSANEPTAKWSKTPMPTPWSHSPHQTQLSPQSQVPKAEPTQQPTAPKPTPYPRWTRHPTPTKRRSPQPSMQPISVAPAYAPPNLTQRPSYVPGTMPVKASQPPPSAFPTAAPTEVPTAGPRLPSPTPRPTRAAPPQANTTPRANTPSAILWLPPNRHLG